MRKIGFSSIYRVKVSSLTNSTQFQVLKDANASVKSRKRLSINFVSYFSGYYRVNYDPELWETLTEVLDDPDQREDIHPLNRGTVSFWFITYTVLYSKSHFENRVFTPSLVTVIAIANTGWLGNNWKNS